MKHFYSSTIFSLIILLICIGLVSPALPFLAILAKVATTAAKVASTAAKVASTAARIGTRLVSFGSRVKTSFSFSTKIIAQQSKLLSRYQRILNSVSQVRELTINKNMAYIWLLYMFFCMSRRIRFWKMFRDLENNFWNQNN